MFGQPKNDQNNQDNGSMGPTPPIPQDLVTDSHDAPFNPALPAPGTRFDDVIAPSSTSVTPSDDNKDDDHQSITPSNSGATNELLDIKQQALNQLSPLVSHLEQTPEEKFRTTMMMIQATDNQDLVKDAYAAAQSITDEKAKAQALLDIVNEINYFTSHHQA